MLELVQVLAVLRNLRRRPLDQPRVGPSQVLEVPRPSEQLLVNHAHVGPRLFDVLQVEHRRIDVPPVGDDGRVLLRRRERVDRVVTGNVVASLARSREVQSQRGQTGNPDHVPPLPHSPDEFIEADHAEHRECNEARQVV